MKISTHTHLRESSHKVDTFPLLILVMGLPGSGKTTFAQALSKSIGARHLNSDIIRAQLDKRGQYDEETKLLIYRELYHETQKFLASGQTVIVDATFYKDYLRSRFTEIAKNLSIPYRLIYINANSQTIKERLKENRTYSEADFQVYQSVKEQFEPIQEPFLEISSEKRSLQEMIYDAQQYINSNS